MGFKGWIVSMSKAIQRFFGRISNWCLRLMKKTRKPTTPNPDLRQDEAFSLGIRKKPGNAFAQCKGAAALNRRFRELGTKMGDIIRRIRFKELSFRWKRRREAAPNWKVTKIFNSYLKTRKINAIKFSNGSVGLIKRITLVTACILFMTGLLFWTRRNIVHFEKETVTKMNKYMSGVAREKAQCIEQSIRDTQDYLSLLSRKPFSGEFKTGQPVRYNDYVAGEAVLEHVGGRVDSIYRIDSKGMVLHRVPYKKGSIGEDVSRTPGIKSVLENHEPSVSEIFPLSSDTLGLCVSHPVFDDETFMGVISIMISLDTLNKSVCPIQTGSPDSIWVINRDGLIVSHANPDFIGRNIFEVEKNGSPNFDWSEFDSIIRRMMSGEEGHGVYHVMVETEGKAEAVKKAIAFLPVKLDSQVWSIALTMDYAEIADPVKRNTRNNFLVTALMMLIFGVVGAIYYRNQKKKAELVLIARSAEELRVSNEKLRLEIEQRIQAERAREESEKNYRLLAENVTDVIWIADLDFRLIYISPSVERVLGIDPHEAAGRTIETVLTPASLEVARQALAEELAAEQEGQSDKSRARTLDLELYRNDKSTIWAETKVSFLYDSEGTPTGLLGVTRDITEKMQLQHQFFQAQKMESVGTLAGGIAHDFNNLISGMLGYASLVKLELGEEHEVFRYADTIERSATRAGELTTQLLAFARSGNYEPKVVNLNEVIGETLEIIDRTFDKSIDIEIQLDDSIPTVEADAGQLQQVLMNLCVNARDAMEGKGTLTIGTGQEILTTEEAHMHADMRPGPYVVLSVSDTGVGMDVETVNRIFEPFFTTKEKGKGTGLGLAMVYGVAKNHGGHVRVFSEPGRGSTFKVYIPASGKPETKEPPKKRIMLGKNEKVLVADDEEVARTLARDALESHGYKVLLARDGVETVELYKEHNGSIGLVIIDMVMPRMGGRETFLKLKELNQNVKAILMTGYGRTEEANRILRSGVLGFIQKPFQLNELLFKVRAALDIRRIPQAPPAEETEEEVNAASTEGADIE